MSIKIQNLSYFYLQPNGEKFEALKNITCTIETGDFTGLLGPTGSGKTTFLQLLAGLRPPTSGEIYFHGEEISSKNFARHHLREKVGVVFQNPEYQLFAATVEKDVAFGLKASGLSREEVTARVQWALETMGFVFEAIRYQSPLALSGGEKRRVALAGVLARQPQILLLDEPIAGLDPYGRQIFLQVLRKINQTGTTVIMASHNMDALAEYTTQLLVLEEGRLVEAGPTREVFTRLKQRARGSFQTKAQRVASLLTKEGKLNPAASVVTYGDLLSALKQELTGGGR